MTQVEYGSMDKIGPDWKEAIRINPDWQPRLIKRTMLNNKSKVNYIRRVHENVKGITKELRDINNPVIRHFGWLKSNERKKMIVDLCNSLWQMDNDNKEIFDTYVLENERGYAASPRNMLQHNEEK